MNQTRNFRCDYIGDTCDDPRCKVGHCAQQHDDNLRSGFSKPTATPAGKIQRELDEAAEQFAREILKAKGRKPTPESIAKLVKLPKVIAEAQRRVDWLKNSN